MKITLKFVKLLTSIVRFVLILLILSVATLFAKKYFVSMLGNYWLIGLFVVAAVFTIIADFLYRHIDGLRFHMFSKETHKILEQGSYDKIFVRDIAKLQNRILDIVMNRVPISHIKIFMYDEATKSYEVVNSRGIERRIQRRKMLDDNHPLIKVLKKGESKLFKKDIINSHKNSNKEKEILKVVLRSLGTAIVFPSHVDGQLIGFVSLGSKLKETEYSLSEEKVLVAMMNHVSLAMENIKFERDLKDKKDIFIEKRKLETLGGLATDCANKIGNPLHGIHFMATNTQDKMEKMINSIEDLEKDKQNLPAIKSVKKLLQIAIKNMKLIESRASYIVEKVDDIIRFSKPSELEVVTIDKAVKSGLNLISENIIKNNNIKIINNVSKDINIKIRLLDIEQVIMNICVNAIESMDEGGIIRVTSHENKDTGFVELYIEDNGKGINDDDLDKIFDFFFTTKKNDGTGLGLALAQKMMEKNGGRIGVKSRQDVGTTFILYFSLYNKETLKKEEQTTEVIGKEI